MNELSLKIAFDAVVSNNVAAVKSFIDNGGDVRSHGIGSNSNEYHFSMLATSIMLGHNELVALLIASGADLNEFVAIENTFAYLSEQRGDHVAMCHLAILRDNCAALRLLIDNGADLTVTDDDGRGLCHYAAERDSEEMLGMLLTARASLARSADVSDKSPLHVAAANENDAVVRVLLNLCVDVNLNQTSDAGRTPCHFAAALNNALVLSALLDAGALPGVADCAKTTPLHLAAANDNEAIVTLLLARDECRAQVDARDGVGNTPLHVAASNENTNVLTLLLNCGASPWALNNAAQLPCHIAAGNLSVGALEALRCTGIDPGTTDGLGRTLFDHAASNKNAAVMSWLLALPRAADCLERRNRWEHTACHVAAINRNAAVMQALISAGVDVNVRDRLGESPLHHAACRGTARLVTMLLAAGAYVDTRGNNAKTLCHYAALNPDENVMRCVLALPDGVDVDARDGSGQTPCHLAILSKSTDVACQIIGAGANVDAADEDGITLCHRAAALHNPRTLRLLVRRGANWRATDSFGKSVGHFANRSTLPFLFAIGADINARDLTGQLVCDRACSYEFQILVAAGADVTSIRKASRATAPLMAAVGHSASATLLGASGQDWSYVYGMIAMEQRVLLRLRAVEVCVGLQSLELSAMELCEILSFAFAPLESMVAFHHVWAIVTAVKHFRDRRATVSVVGTKL